MNSDPANRSFYILHLSTALSWRGGERQIALLAGELQRKNIRQAVFCARESRMAEWCEQNGIVWFSFRRSISVNPFSAWKLKRLCDEHSFTHLHAHDSHAHTTAYLAATLFHTRTPLIVHRRVDFPIGGNLLSRLKYNHSSVSAIICVSRFISQLIAPVIADPSKLEVVYSGIDLQYPDQAEKNVLRSSFHIPPSHFIIANIAALAPHKDYFTFVDTAERLLKDGFPASFFLIGGDGGEMERVRAYIRSKGLEKQLILTGFRNDIPGIWQEVDLLLFTSKTEGLGTTLLDAFAAGVPVVATRAGGIPEIVEHGVTGLLGPPGHARELAEQVRKMLGNKALRESIIKAAREKVRSFSREQMALGVLAVYQRTLN